MRRQGKARRLIRGNQATELAARILDDGDQVVGRNLLRNTPRLFDLEEAEYHMIRIGSVFSSMIVAP